MGFSIGTDDEMLLTCAVCKSAFGLKAQFCGDCGANRLQAQGVERASIKQVIIPNVATVPSYSQDTSKSVGASTISQASGGRSVFAAGLPNQGSGNTPSSPFPPSSTMPPPPAAPKVSAKKKEQNFNKQVRRQDRQLRIEKFGEWQDRRSPIIFSLGFISILALSFVLTQSYIFVSSSPASVADKYILDGASRSPNYQNINNDVEDAPNFQFFPVKFSTWNSSKADAWSNSYSWNGWLGKASVTAIASGVAFEDDVIAIDMKAIYTKKWLIFREIEWIAADHAATLELTYPSNKSLRIYINGFAAGTVGNPLVKPGKYYVYPGELNFVFYDQYGKKTENDQYFFIGLSGAESTIYS
jgi:hypothetical protein